MSLDSPTNAVGIFAIGVALIVAAIVIGVGATAFAGNANSTSLLTNGNQMFLNMGNGGFILIALALILFSVLGSFFLPTHPIFVVIDIIFLPISVWIASVVQNTWFTTMSTLATQYGYTTMNAVMSNLVIIIVVADIVTAIASYAIIKNNYG